MVKFGRATCPSSNQKLGCVSQHVEMPEQTVGPTNVSIQEKSSKSSPRAHFECEKASLPMGQKVVQNSRNVPGERSDILQTKDGREVASTSTVNPDEREFIVDSGASMHMMRRPDLSPKELESRRMGQSTQTRRP